MHNPIKVTLLGGDMRHLSMAKDLHSQGFETKLWGIDKIFCHMKESISLCDSWETIVSECDLLILPLPASKDGMFLNCPLLNKGCEPKLDKILDNISPKTIVFGGKIPPTLEKKFQEKGIRSFDYFVREEVQVKNAVPTAEGALAIAMNELSIALSGAKSAVLGYGRIGKILAHKLKALDSDVTVFARKHEDIAWAESFGIKGRRIAVKNGAHALQELSSGYHVIFNTIPVCILDEPIISQISPETLIVDLASSPGGLDLSAAEAHGIHVVRALSLPGKCAPATAGTILSESIVEILREEGIL